MGGMDDEPSYDISINTDDSVDATPSALLETVIETALQRHGVTRAVITVSVVSDPRIAELNERFLSHSGPTDVLTFDLRTPDSDGSATTGNPVERRSGDTAAEQAPALEGEIVVSSDTAQREAVARGHALSAELSLYVLHGVLHLLGYGDHDEEDARRMHAMEDELLTAVGTGPVFGRPEV